MREIKFRAWHKEKGRMYNASKIFWISCSLCLWRIELFDIYADAYEQDSFWVESKEVDLMQYTGLKDCEGKEIYEGDIIECEHLIAKNRQAGLVEFKWSSFCVQLKYVRLWVAGLLNQYKVKIIGNIHENPKLLGSKE